MSANQNLINQQINVHIVKQDGGRQTTEIIPLMVHGKAGHDLTITPHDYLPKGYYIDSMDHDQILHFNADSSVTPDYVKFVYDRQGSHQPQLGLITVHYQDSEAPGRDINAIKVHKTIGKPFALSKYKYDLPIGTYLIGVSQGAERFTKRAQDVVILVRHYVRALLLFEDAHEQVIERRPLLSHYEGSQVPYAKLKHYVPAGYQFVKWGPHRKTLHPKDVDIMLVKRIPPKNGPASTAKGTGKVLVNYADHGQVVDRRVKIGQLGKPFDLTYYYQHLPAGYRFVRLVTGANVHRFTKGLQLIWIEVSH